METMYSRTASTASCFIGLTRGQRSLSIHSARSVVHASERNAPRSLDRCSIGARSQITTSKFWYSSPDTAVTFSRPFGRRAPRSHRAMHRVGDLGCASSPFATVALGLRDRASCGFYRHAGLGSWLGFCTFLTFALHPPPFFFVCFCSIYIIYKYILEEEG